MSTLSASAELAEVVAVIEAVERQRLDEKTWIPDDLHTAKTFFSVNDLWHYIGVYADTQCEHCAAKDGHDFVGVELRVLFPDLVVVDEDHIYVNLHMTLWGKDTCKCELLRVGAPISPDFPDVTGELE